MSQIQKKLMNIIPNDLQFPSESKLFISENLNSYFRNLGFHCRRLKREKLIEKYKFQNEAFYINIRSDNKCKITHINDLINLFPVFFDEDF